MKRIALFVFSLLAGITSSEACTSFLIGKKASADGSVMITYSMDSFGMFTNLQHFPAAKHPAGTMRQIVDGDTNHYLGEIPEAPQTYAVMGNINAIAVSVLADCACIVLCENSTLDEDAKNRAEMQGVWVLSSEENAYTLANKLGELL